MERVPTIFSMGTCEKANDTEGGGLNVNRQLLAELAISGRLGSINRGSWGHRSRGQRKVFS
jgi:hypothetical protein